MKRLKAITRTLMKTLENLEELAKILENLEELAKTLANLEEKDYVPTYVSFLR